MGSEGMEDDQEETQRTLPHPSNNPRIEVTRAESTDRTQSDNEEDIDDSMRISQQRVERRGSVPTGLVEHHLNPQSHSICGQILRVMGDEHYSKGLGKHLRYMGDEMCYSYYLRNAYYNSTRENSSTLTNSHSLPDLRRQKHDKE
ncbi:uncharacterized protein LOC133173833 [Saccostrea echinata]|uniref:uncharacterized protein LOC133173833 n=1 Tax=Saccostrea echinata TaxID=191078 RepID=UPI002A8317EF|nr:uncharacterized protein LOC133173833 [Saccostrea echinata]